MASDDETTRDAAASEHDDAHEHADDHEHTGDRGDHESDDSEHAEGHAGAERAYDPHKIEVPSRQPPLRSTAPQSDFATTQVVRGAVVLVFGLALTFGLGIVLA